MTDPVTIQIKDLDPALSPARTLFLPAQADTGEAYHLTVAQIIGLLQTGDLPFDPTGNPLDATTVQAALVELMSRIAIDPSAIGSALFAAASKAAARAAIDAAGVARGYLYGLTLSNNVADANYSIDIAAGECAADVALPSLLTTAGLSKKLNASWSVGTGQGGLDSGSKANSTWYHVFLIARSDTGVVDALFSTAPTSPTMPTHYDLKRRIGAVRTDGSGNILAFFQRGDDFLWKSAILDVNATKPGTTAVLRTLSVPTGINVWWMGSIGLLGTSGSFDGVRLSSPDQTDQAASTTAAPLMDNYIFLPSNTPYGVTARRVLTDTSARIRTRMLSNTADLLISTDGWTDNRGRLG